MTSAARVMIMDSDASQEWFKSVWRDIVLGGNLTEGEQLRLYTLRYYARERPVLDISVNDALKMCRLHDAAALGNPSGDRELLGLMEKYYGAGLNGLAQENK